ncbi:hypothetical protein [Streptomyces sp. NPDC096311]
MHVVRRSPVTTRVQAINQIRTSIVTAPARIRDTRRHLPDSRS